jgi:hypothetical protein
VNYWIFTVKDQKSDGKRLAAKDIFDQRMADEFWGLKAKARNAKYLRKGDGVVYYIAKPAKVLGGYSVLGSNFDELPEKERDRLSHGKELYRAGYGVYLKQITSWDPPRSIEAVLPDLKFIKNKKNWSAHLHGEVHRIPEEDFRVLTMDSAAKYTQRNTLEKLQAELSSSAVERVEEEIEKVAGFQSNSKVRKAVEMHAMKCAEIEFGKRGYEVEDVSATQSYDLLCKKKNGERKYVEVKGTQGRGLEVILTIGEVNFINERGTDCILCIVHGIKVTGQRTPKASEGNLSVSEPFDLSTGILRPIAFTFRRVPQFSGSAKRNHSTHDH